MAEKKTTKKRAKKRAPKKAGVRKAMKWDRVKDTSGEPFLGRMAWKLAANPKIVIVRSEGGRYLLKYLGRKGGASRGTLAKAKAEAEDLHAGVWKKKSATKKPAKKAESRSAKKRWKNLERPNWDLFDDSSIVLDLSKEKVTYKDLVRTFGKPFLSTSSDSIGADSVHEWHVVFDDGTAADIYDYKDSPLYEPGDYGISDEADEVPKSTMDKWRREYSGWSVGSPEKRGGRLVLEALGKRQEHELKKMGTAPTRKKASQKAKAPAASVAQQRRTLKQYLRDVFGI